MSQPWADAHVGRFQNLCSIPSPSLAEAEVGLLVKESLDLCGLRWSEDGAAAAVGGDQGNLLCLVPGLDQSRRILIAAHLDTVPPGEVLKPVREGTTWSNAGDGILGIDNKAAVAALLTAASVWAEAPPEISVVLAFTVAEEISLLGSRALSLSPEMYEACFVFDHPTPMGTWVARSPWHQRIELDFRGRAAHAGVSPEAGASAVSAAAEAITAMKMGRIDAETTVNAGVIRGGTAINVVPEHCHLVCEVRSLSSARLVEETRQVIDAAHKGAQSHGCSVDAIVTPSFSGYEHGSEHHAARVGTRALLSLGIEPIEIASAGGSDVNIFEAMGIPSLNLGDGSSHTHTADEQIEHDDLLGLVELTLALPKAAVELV